MLTLSWSDGNTLIPVNSCLLASSKETNIIGPINSFDRRTLAGKRRKLAQTKAPQAMMTLLDTAMLSGLSADYVLFDSWFSNPAQIAEIKKKGMDVIAMIKKSSRIKYTYNGEQLNIKEIYSKNKKRRGKSKYLLSVDVMVGKIIQSLPKSYASEIKLIVKIGLLSYALIRLLAKKRSFESMENVGKLCRYLHNLPYADILEMPIKFL